MDDTDTMLLARNASHQAEDAFAEIVRRHLGLVYSAALRHVRAPQLAEEVAQSTFIKLARYAGQLAPDTILPAWLYQVTRREAIDVVRREASRQLREQIATEMNAMNATAADWTHIEPLLDEAMHALDDTDRTAVLLRYFENKSLREVGATLGTSENAAQKRLARAVERLREFFAKRGVTVGASGLVVVISANAVQAAPVGLMLTISTAAAIAGSTIYTTATLTQTTVIAMNSIKAKFAVAIICAVIIAGTGTFLVRQQKFVQKDTKSRLQTATPVMVPILTHWQQGDQSAAVSNFVEAIWSARPLFAPDSVLSLSEAQFQSQVRSWPVLGNVNSRRTEMTDQLDVLKRIAASVAQAGIDEAVRKDFAQARKHFTSLKHCGEALDSTNSLAILKLVGQGIKKRAETELGKLPQ